MLRDVVTTAFYRWRFVLLMLLVPLLAAVALVIVTPVRHTAEGLLVVTLSRESAGTTDISGFGPSILSIDTPKAVQSELEIVASDAVAQAALRRIGPATLYPRWPGAACSACSRQCPLTNNWNAPANCCAATCERT